MQGKIYNMDPNKSIWSMMAMVVTVTKEMHKAPPYVTVPPINDAGMTQTTPSYWRTSAVLIDWEYLWCNMQTYKHAPRAELLNFITTYYNIFKVLYESLGHHSLKRNFESSFNMPLKRLWIVQNRTKSEL